MKPSSKFHRAPLRVHVVSRFYATGGRRFHTGGSLLVQGKPLIGQLICFEHRTAQHICHCNSPKQVRVGTRTRIPAKDHLGGWRQLYDHLWPAQKYETFPERRLRLAGRPVRKGAGYDERHCLQLRDRRPDEYPPFPRP